MVLIRAGTFMMGSNKGYHYEKPVHRVTLSAFYLDKHEMTVEQGLPVRAVLSVAHEADECEAALRRDWFLDFGGPLYTIEWTDRARRPTRRDGVGGLGDFRDLKQLQLFDALGSGQ